MVKVDPMWIEFVWAVTLFSAIICDEVRCRAVIETSERHSGRAGGFSGGLYGRISS
ncbi:MAG: hypothetical protein ACYCZR_01640 [Burkholderiales bacterium]